MNVTMTQREFDTAKADAKNWLLTLNEAKEMIDTDSDATALDDAIKEAEDRVVYWDNFSVDPEWELV